ncbi:hypothetical protein ACSTS3_03645 [Aquimarina muelleri]|uniref:hypothetical protein n=1 Tax=Aquimarina muelleri TaxID=279356 RepID=UPI003F685542
MKKRLIFLFLTTLLIVQSLHSQTFPVTLVPQVTPPAPIYFSSYANASSINSPLKLQIILNDLSQLSREIKLKIYFEGNGISFQSKSVVIGSPSLFIEGGIPLILTNAELSPYFSYENIIGIPPTAYGQVIPEGSYQFCFEVYDALTETRISQKTCATTFIFQNEPPLLVTPHNQIDITEQDPLNLLFQWTPRHINVTNVQYELSIVEIWDQTINPQAAFLASPPFFQTTTTNTSYLYGPADPLFLSNKRYAWRVKAKALNGAEEIGLFKNNGFSEVYWFNYTAPCDTPNNVTHEVKGAQQANILWDDFTTDVPEFIVRYREKGNNNEWFISKTSSNWLTLWDLRPGATYEYQVHKKCLISESEYSILQTFTTLEESDEASLVDCGISPDMDIENIQPLEQLFPGDIFTAGDFPIKVTETNGNNGRFSGKGYVTFPYFKNIKVAVNFTNVFVNNEKQLAEGMVMTVYDSKWDNVLDVDEVIDVGEDIVDVFTGGDNTHIPKLDYDIDTNDISITDGQIIITKPDGSQDTFDYDKGDTYIITDVSGDKWTIDKEGNITQTGKGDPSPNLTSSNSDGIQSGTHAGTIDDPYVDTIINNVVKVTFREHKENEEETRFALDQVNNDFETSTYSKIKTSDGNDYYPPHKAAVQGEDDVFYADIEISDSNINIDSLIIKTVKNSAIKHERLAGTNTYKIIVSGINPYQNEECVITYLDSADKKYKIAASFFIHHIRKQKEIPIQVITVNGGKNIPDFEIELNKIYSRAGGKFKIKPKVIDITIAQNSWDDNNNNKIDYDGSGILSDYPTELKNIYKEFKKQYPGYDSQQYFVLVLSNEFTVSKPLSGFMPKTRQWGFLFEKHIGNGLEKKDSALKVAAHELGHGVFTLEHPFGENLDNAGKASTWLMDYGDGTELGYPNWATMSDSSLKLMFFQEDSGGEFAANEFLTGNAVAPRVFNQYKVTINTTSNNKQCISFVSPANKLISIPIHAEDVTFYHTGSLYAFSVLESGKLERYVAAKGRKDGQELFMGYLKSLGKSDTWKQRTFQDDFSRYLGKQVTVHLGKLKRTSESCGINLYKREGYTNDADENSWNSGGRIEILKKEDLLTGLTPYITNLSSPEACDLCPKGNKFYNEYSYLIKNYEGSEALFGIGKMICSKDQDKIDYDILIAQINKDFSDQVKNIFWGSDKALFIKARDKFWKKENALPLYLKALQKVNKNIKSYNEKLGNNATKEEFYTALYYLNDEFIKTLNFEERISLLEFIFKNNAYITEALFYSDGKDDLSLIKKIIKTLSPDELSSLISEILGNKSIFNDKKEDKEKQRYFLFEIINALDKEALSSLYIDHKLLMLQVLLEDKLTNMFGNNEDAIVTKVVASVKDTEAEHFFDELESSKNYSIDKAPLLYNLKSKLAKLLDHEESYSKFFLELNRLSDAINLSKDGNLEVKTSIQWNVRQRDFALVAFVENNNDFKYQYDENTHTVSITKCVKYEYTYNVKLDKLVKQCVKEVDLLPKGSSPFDLVGVTITSDVSPLASDCRFKNTNNKLCGKMIVVPAIFLDYLDTNLNIQKWENFGWNVFNVAITVFTLGDGALAIKAIHGAAKGTKVTIALENSYQLLDFAYTVPNLIMGASQTGVYGCQNETDINEYNACKKKWAIWENAGLAFAVKDGIDLPKSIIKTVAWLKTIKKAEIADFIKGVGLKKYGKTATEEDVLETVDKLEELINENPDLKREYDQTLATTNIDIPSFKTTFLKKLDRYKEDLTGLKKWIAQLDDSNASLLQKLDNLGDDIVKFGEAFDFSTTSSTSKFIKNPDLIVAWDVLKSFPKISAKDGNLEILSKVSSRFEYRGQTAYNGLNKLFNEGSEVASKQNLINGLAEVDKIFNPNLPVKFSGIKRGDVKVYDANAIDGTGKEIARYIDGILQKKKTLEKGEIVGKYDEDDILRNGEEVGFNINAGGVKKLWSSIDETLGDFRGKIGTYYDVNLTLAGTRQRIGVSTIKDDILELHLNVPGNLQGQGISSQIVKQAVLEDSPKAIKGWWKKQDIYTSGESINLTIFKRGKTNNLSDIEAALQTPSGKIFAREGFNKVKVVKNTPDEVIMHFFK